MKQKHLLTFESWICTSAEGVSGECLRVAGMARSENSIRMRYETTVTIRDSAHGAQRRARPVLVALPSFYVAVIAATIIDGVVGGSLIAFCSLLLVLVMTIALLRASRRLRRPEEPASRLWQLARCTAAGATLAVVIGILVMLFGDGTSTTVATGLALASFSMLYGVLLALPAGCAVVWLERDA